jgi:L-alanine-DL-glutamate epimerase-like enolase superfamily enzyme
MAEAWHVPVAFHDCTGPVGLTVATHLALNARNCWVQEIVRAFYYGWYHRFVTELPPIANGEITVGPRAGLGLALQPDLVRREGTTVRRTSLQDL